MIDGDQLTPIRGEGGEPAIAAEAAHGGLDHIAHEGGGHHGIEGIAARRQHGEAGLHLRGMTRGNDPALGFGFRADGALRHADFAGSTVTESVTFAVAARTLQIGQWSRASWARSRRSFSGAEERMTTLRAPSAIW